MTDAGHPKDYAALSVTISETLLSVFTLIINIKTKYIFFAATILMGFAKIGFLLCKYTLGALITSTLIGAIRSWLNSAAFSCHRRSQNRKICLGLRYQFCYQLFSHDNFDAIVGIIRDWTDSYEMYQISLLIVNSVFILSWMLQFIFVDFRKWRKQCTQKANTINYRWE